MAPLPDVFSMPVSMDMGSAFPFGQCGQCVFLVVCSTTFWGSPCPLGETPFGGISIEMSDLTNEIPYQKTAVHTQGSAVTSQTSLYLTTSGHFTQSLTFILRVYVTHQGLTFPQIMGTQHSLQQAYRRPSL